MQTYDLCLAWNWEYDAAFVKLLDTSCQSYRLSILQVTPQNLAETLLSLERQKIAFRLCWDRASESDAAFQPLLQWTQQHRIPQINPTEYAMRTWDKASTHRLLTQAGVRTPPTLILPSYQAQPILASFESNGLGKRWIMKPAHGGGGDGVVTDITDVTQVLAARQHYPTDQYLLQTHIVTSEIGLRPAWFRLIYCAGRAYPAWWDTRTHIYTPISATAERYFRLQPLRDMTAAIAAVCKLDLFSTEIALNDAGQFVVVDYANDPLDLRLQSEAQDGVPDAFVQDIAERVSRFVAVSRRISRSSPYMIPASRSR